MLAAVANDTDLEYLMLDGSTVRVHQHGAAKKQQQADIRIYAADKAVFLINDLGDKTAVYFSKTPEDSLLTDADNIKHSDLTGADNGNKPTLPDGQDDQIGFCS
ncbi:hypothetical protein [Methylobacter sp.]|uniref:hypothetical protein n=1 Tax=Methylobacter sp. TaxID=2051955 RepID=UPI003DA4DE45